MLSRIPNFLKWNQMIEVGKIAPQFELLDSNNNKISLIDYHGKKIVLYFYPKDMTSGCTQQACNFRDAFSNFKKINTIIIGISADSTDSHKKFADQYDLPFILLSDEKKEVVKKYGVWKEKSLYGRKYMGIERTTFIIDGDGYIQNIFSKVKVAGHIEEVIKALKG